MQKAKLTLALASLGVVGLVASHPASAQIATVNSGNSDLVFAAVDQKTGETFYENLGILALPSGGVTSPINLATTGGTAWTTFVTHVGTDQLNFAVFGGGNRNAGAPADPVILPGSNPPFPLNSYSITVGGTGTAPQAPTNGNLAQFNIIDQNIIGQANSGSADITSGNGYDVTAATNASMVYTDASGNTSVGGKFGGITDVAEGSKNDFWNFTQTKTATSTTTTASTGTLLGTFSFSGSTLSFAAAGGAPVPLPAAVWLLGSGLFGLVGIGRRRAA